MKALIARPPCGTVQPLVPSRQRSTLVAKALPRHDLSEAHSRAVEAAAAATFAAPWWESAPALSTTRTVSEAEQVSSGTLKDKFVHMRSDRMFVSALAQQAFLRDDWLDITSRPFVSGHVDALLANTRLHQRLQTDEELRRDVEVIVANIDVALSKGQGLSWLVALFAAPAHFPGIYQLVEVADRSVGNDVLLRFEADVDTHLARLSPAELHREVRLVKHLLSPLVLGLLLRFASAVITPEFVLWVATLMDDTVTQSDLLTSLSQDSRDSA